MSTAVSDRAETAKADLVERAAALLGADAPLLRHYYRHVAPEDVVGVDLEDLAGTVRSHLEVAARRPSGTTLVRVLNPTRETDDWQSRHTVVEVVTEDMPHLVASASAELARHDLAIHVVVHPVFLVERDALGGSRAVHLPNDPAAPAGAVREAFIHVEVDRQVSPERLQEVRTDLRRVLEDVRAVAEDHARIEARVDALRSVLSHHPPPVDPREVVEAVELLDWMCDGNFTFLGYREYDLTGPSGDEALASRPGTGLGILRDAGFAPVSHSFAAMAPAARARALEPHLLTLTKANSRSTVQRPSYLDYIGIKRFSEGRPVGEYRVLGLFAPVVYVTSVTSIPVVRHKVSRLLQRTDFPPDGHDAVDLRQIVEEYPRDELFQVSDDDLERIALGILHLQERRKVAVFLRDDLYGRFASALVYLPRDRYSTAVRERIQEVLQQAFAAATVDWTTHVTDSVLARVHFVVRGAPREVDTDDLRQRIAAATRSWSDELVEALQREYDEARALELRDLWSDAFPEAYKEDYDPLTGLADVARLEAVEPGRLGLELDHEPGAPPEQLRFKLYQRGPAISLSDVMPVLTAMGVEVTDERPYEMEPRDGSPAWIYDFGLRARSATGLRDDDLRQRFRDAFAAVWEGRAENDGFNALVLVAGLAWEEVAALRAYAKYLRQAGTTFSQAYIEQTLTANPVIAADLVRLFSARFDPAVPAGERAERAATITTRVVQALDAVGSLDDDRIMRSLLHLVGATLRTNAWSTGGQPHSSALSLKLDPQRVPGIPDPRPAFEVWVCSPQVEGVHLRFGAVARGGIRWSDRREDFRTEVLGLVKAQTVKNAVIVPVGAKGGFVVKRSPADPDALRAEVVASYSTFVSGLLDVTDNLVDGVVVPPRDVVRHDGDDTYLVVAADKGTATFSDIANGIAAEYGFWLGDAFASGGSAGYDHKEMGITARGAWVSVQRHFRELDVDVQSQDFTVVGVGDMSGDVFGNGMLLSRHIRLVAAFDHRHVFVDPDPHSAVSFAERERLFVLPRSSWDDYDRSLISDGGGVWPRTAKSVPISEEMRCVLGLAEDVTALTPTELISGLLRAPVDLLWNGGIGTYVKASTESHLDVGDKANDTLRVDGRDLRCKVVGEGGNLGFTQRGRVEFALAGGRINTDAIDNSAGVDASDHEVNIKILLNPQVAAGRLPLAERNALLERMTPEVAALVLRDNYEQTLALGISVVQAPGMVHIHADYIGRLERDRELDRSLERLPTDEEIAARRATGQGLTAPELAVLLAYTKITVTRSVLGSDGPEDPVLGRELAAYFPSELRKSYADLLEGHPLRREIVATAVSNRLVNYAGITFVHRLREETGAAVPDLVRAWAAAREVFAVPALVDAIESLDGVVAARVQTRMQLAARQLVERASRWLLQHRPSPLDIAACLAELRPGVAEVVEILPRLVAVEERASIEQTTRDLTEAGVPAQLATRVATLGTVFSALDVVAVASAAGRPVQEVAAVYVEVDERLLISTLRRHVLALPRDSRWQTMARAALRDDLYAAHAALVADVVRSTSSGMPAEERVTAWVEANAVAVTRAAQILGDIVASETSDLATMSVALRQIRSVLRSGTS